LWVRVSGPEIFAGSAFAVPQSSDSDTSDSSALLGSAPCYWEFEFDLQVVGSYKVDIKVLQYNGEQRVDLSQCPVSRDTTHLPFQDYPFSQALIGFKLYTPDMACCEICARTPDCQYWMSPPLSLSTQARQAGCELFFTNDPKAQSERLLVGVPTWDSNHPNQPLSGAIQTALQALDMYKENHKEESREKGVWEPSLEHGDRIDVKVVDHHHRRLSEFNLMHGPGHSDPTSYFVGCGWSFWFTHDFPCFDPSLDDAVPVFPASMFEFVVPTSTEQKRDAKSLPRCQIDRDEQLRTPQTQQSYGRWVRYEWPDNQTCPLDMQADEQHNALFDIMQFDGEHPECWHQDDLTRIGDKCMEFCGHASHQPWRSHLKDESQWYGIWENYHCQYSEFTNHQLQECIDRRRISSIQVEGKSVAAFLKQYVNQRLENIVLYNATASGPGPAERKVVLTTFGLPHLLWRKGTAEWEAYVASEIPPAQDDEDHYWVSGFYYSSEREPHVHVGRSLQLSRLLESSVRSKGYKLLEAFDLTAAFTFDTATQMDGLHIIGPPAKMIVKKLFHYMCTN